MFWRYVLILTAVLSLAGGGVAQYQSPPLDYYPTDTWIRATPESQGMDSGILADLFEEVISHGWHFHSILIIRHGYLVVEANLYPLSPDYPQSVHSITKSITATLFGIARYQGYFDSWPSDRVVDLFSDRQIANLDRKKEFIRVEHLLNMTSGLDWPEWEVSIWSPDNVARQMMDSPDPIQFVLDRPMATWPGRVWNYNSGTWHLISALIKKFTGTSPEAFAMANLFQPLGIRVYQWEKDRTGLPWGGTGLALRPRDLAKIGLLYLQQGTWEGNQLLPDWWVRNAVRSRVAIPESQEGYGYGWYTFPYRWRGPEEPPVYFCARGGYGDELCVLPELDLIVVRTGSLGSDDSGASAALWEHVISSVKAEGAIPEAPERLARLEAALARLSHPPEVDQPQDPRVLSSLPPLAQEISGKTYRLEENPFLRDFRLVFRENKAFFTVRFPTGVIVSIPLSFDEVWRFSEIPSFFPPPHVGALGQWKDDRTLQVNYQIPEESLRVRIVIEFTGSGVTCIFTDLLDGYSLEVKGS